MIDLLVVSHATFKGVNRYVFNLLAEQHGLNVQIIAPKQLLVADKWTDADPQGPGENMHFLTLNGTNPRRYDYEGLYDLADKLKPKVIYLDNDPVSIQALRLGRWAKRHQARLICLSCENLAFDPVSTLKRLGGIKGFLNGLMKTGLMYLTRPLVHHVFTINDAGTRIFKKCGYKNVGKTPLGFNPAIFKPDPEAGKTARIELGIDNNFVIAYIGRLVPEKGIDLLIRSLKRLEHLNWIFILDQFDSHADPYQQEIIKLIDQLGLPGKVKHFTASHTAVYRYMNAADLVVIPSKSTPRWVEQYGRVAPESMACGKIVLAANTGALPELIGDAGLLFEEGNEQDLSLKIESIILNAAQYSAYKEKAKKRAHAHLDIYAQAALIYEVIR